MVKSQDRMRQAIVFVTMGMCLQGSENAQIFANGIRGVPMPQVTFPDCDVSAEREKQSIQAAQTTAPIDCFASGSYWFETHALHALHESCILPPSSAQVVGRLFNNTLKLVVFRTHGVAAV